MFAIGNNELEQSNNIKVSIKCSRCNKKHKVTYGERIMPDGSREISKILGFVKCGKATYIVSVDGKAFVKLVK